MSKRTPRPLFLHDGFLFRQVKTLTDGSELLYCDKRQTLGCTASAKRVHNHIFLKSGHTMHEPDDAVANAKLARYTVKKIAAETTCTPKELLAELGALPLAGSRDSITKMINRARQTTPKPSSFDPMHESMDGFDASDSFAVPPINIQEALEQMVKQEAADPEETGDPHDLSLFEHEEDESITIPNGTFLEDIRDVVRESVQDANRDMIREITSEVGRIVSSKTERAQTTRNTPDDLLRGFLESVRNVDSDFISDDLKQRAEAALNKIENKTLHVNLEQVLEATLRSLDA